MKFIETILQCAGYPNLFDAIIGIFFGLLTYWIKKKNTSTKEFISTIKALRNSLPTPQKSGKPMSKENSKKLGLDTSYFQVRDLSTQVLHLTPSEKDNFENQLRNFEFKETWFPKYYKKYSDDKLRLLADDTSNPIQVKLNMDILQGKIYDEVNYPLKPYKVLLYIIKFDNRLTSRLYWELKKVFNRR